MLEMERAKKYVGLPRLRSVALKYNFWWQFEAQKYQEDLYGKSCLRACHPAILTLFNLVSL